MIVVQYINLVLRFILELAVLASAGMWGFRTGQSAPIKCLLGLGSPIVIAVLWGTFGSPKASYPLTGFMHVMLELIVFGVGAVALYSVGYTKIANSFVILVIMNRVLMFIWKQ